MDNSPFSAGVSFENPSSPAKQLEPVCGCIRLVVKRQILSNFLDSLIGDTYETYDIHNESFKLQLRCWRWGQAVLYTHRQQHENKIISKEIHNQRLSEGSVSNISLQNFKKKDQSSEFCVLIINYIRNINKWSKSQSIQVITIYPDLHFNSYHPDFNTENNLL